MIQVGDIVKIKKLNKKGKVIKVLNNGTYMVDIDSIRVHILMHELEKVNEMNIQPKNNTANRNRWFKTTDPFKYNDIPLELDLHGYTLREAKVEVDDCLQKAIQLKVKVIHIIHGKGTGVLRQGIQDLLKSYKIRNIITDFHYAEYHEGSYGKTVVYIQ